MKTDNLICDEEALADQPSERSGMKISIDSEEPEGWTNRWAFILAAVGSAIGL